MLPVIQVKSEDDLTTAIIRFAISTLQTDIQTIADGSASAETLKSYTEDLLNYIAEDQNIDASKIAPEITAIADIATTQEDTSLEINALLNDSYVTSSPFSLSQLIYSLLSFNDSKKFISISSSCSLIDISLLLSCNLTLL